MIYSIYYHISLYTSTYRCYSLPISLDFPKFRVRRAGSASDWLSACCAMLRRSAQRCCDLYAALGVRPNASQGELREAYLRMAKQHHPDVSWTLILSQGMRHTKVTGCWWIVDVWGSGKYAKQFMETLKSNQVSPGQFSLQCGSTLVILSAWWPPGGVPQF